LIDNAERFVNSKTISNKKILQLNTSSKLFNSINCLSEESDIILTRGLHSWEALCTAIVSELCGNVIARELGESFGGSDGKTRHHSAFSFFPITDHGDNAIVQTQQYIHAHYGEALDLKQLSNLAALNERTLQRRFIKATGFTPRDYLQQIRMKKACDMLLSRSNSAKQTAFNVGYKSSASFSRIFRKIVGMSPQEFVEKSNAG
jgi:transcriptional regulator GlxA family with amidase domain